MLPYPHSIAPHIRLAIFAFTLALIVGLTHRLIAAEPDKPAAPRPNIVFILADDMGWPDLACYGHKFHETPTLDKLATQGMRFTDFYAATPVCSSTRSTIQTGQYSARTGITDFIPGHWRPFEKLIVPPIEHQLAGDVTTVGDVLRGAGYVTGYFGKWHLGNTPEQQPDKRGYDVTAGQLGEAFKPWRATKGAGPKQIDLLTDQTLYFIEQNKDKPFFVTLSHHAVHIPVEARAATVAKYQAKPKPAEGVNNPAYAAMVEDMDASVARVLSLLDELELAERTLVIVASDNGGLRRIYTGVGEDISANAPLRDEKGSIYEGGIRVPMIVRWPGVIAPATTCSEPTTTADLLPTLCAAVGAALPDQPIDGLSMTPLFKDPAAALDRDAIYFHYPHYHHSRPAGAIRQGDLKLIEYFDDGKLELYNLKVDLGESTNLAGAMPEMAGKMRQRLAAWRKDVGARMPTPNPKFDPEHAHEWWNKGTNKPLDVQAMAEHYKTRNPSPEPAPAGQKEDK